MPAVAPLALIIDHDFGFLSEAASALSRAGFQVSARLSPRGLAEFLSACRPDVILLGLSFWDQGWGDVLRSFSPDSIVYPVSPETEHPGVADLDRLSTLLIGRGPDAGRGEESHAA
ncbi:MAG TPA: hypothetical protein VE981_17870 [Planctomycetota bacterium]|nr:hypothetical protein [Planctomycetota bacterium]